DLQATHGVPCVPHVHGPRVRTIGDDEGGALGEHLLGEFDAVPRGTLPGEEDVTRTHLPRVVGDACAGPRSRVWQAAAEQTGDGVGVQQVVRSQRRSRAGFYLCPHASHPIHTLHNVCNMCIGSPLAPSAPFGAVARQRAEASASVRGTSPQAATMSVASSPNRVPVAIVLVAPSAGLCSITTAMTRGSSAGSMPATLRL